jgi:hypothetical protein
MFNKHLTIMKKLVYLISFLIALPAFTQTKSVDDLFNKYALQDGFVTVTVSKGALNLLAAMDPEDKDLQTLAGGITNIRILATEKSKGQGSSMDFYKEILPGIPVKDYTELVHVRSLDQNVVILVKENKGIINDFLLVVGGEDNALISIQGNIDLKQLGKLSASMPGSGLHHLDKVNQ